ncbi:MAG TPA: N-acetyl-alpha-D-glucosaminyl L-malate synthase BshA [Candidatus Angelobacter sp.]|nr:N-acetyl-alpha-D-glucosaminyl L-malate synthase BshA [Candidatus Angelobacter sp.]
MKIGITCYPSYGGSGVVATELGMELARRGHEVHFISYALPFRLKQFRENVVFHEVQMLAYPLFQYPPYTLALAAKLAEVADEYQLDVLHAHYALPHAVCAYLARQVAKSTKLKIVTTLHGTDITLVGSDPSFHALTKFGIEQSDGVTAVSHYLREKTIEVFEVDRPIEVIPNFVDTAKFAPRVESSCKKEQFVKKGERLLLHISNFRPSKCVTDVVRVFAAVRREVPSRLLLIGDGPERVPTREVADDLGVTKWVRWLGQLDAVEDVLGCSDLFILPSRNESFGLAGLEAMSSGVPVVATAAEGLPELIRNGETGYLLPVGDVEGMARRSIEILSDEKRHAAMSQASRRIAIEHYEVGKVIPMYEEFYGKVLGHPVRIPQPFTPPDALA